MASGGASAHCSPGDRHAWPKVSAPTARAPARWSRSTAGVHANPIKIARIHATSPPQTAPTQDDPHKLRRLRRATGPRSAVA